jgi:hypothetical protein
LALVKNFARGFPLQALAFRGERWEPPRLSPVGSPILSIFPQESSAFRYNPLTVLNTLEKANTLRKGLSQKYKRQSNKTLKCIEEIQSLLFDLFLYIILIMIDPCWLERKG